MLSRRALGTTSYPTVDNKLLNNHLNASCDYSQRVSITNYLPRIICKSFNFEWLSKSKILNKQTKWGKSISLAGTSANANFTSWKQNKNSTVSEWGWKQSPQMWISEDMIMQITGYWRRGSSQSWGEGSHEGYDALLEARVSSTLTLCVSFTLWKCSQSWSRKAFLLWTYRLSSLLPLIFNMWSIVMICDIYSVFYYWIS